VAMAVVGLPAPTVPQKQHVVAPSEAGSVTAQTTDGWLAGRVGENCDSVCARSGMFCEVAEQQAHIKDADLVEKMNALLVEAKVLTIVTKDIQQKQSTCMSHDTVYGSDPNVPGFYQPDWMWPRGAYCHLPDFSRPTSTYSCQTGPGGITQRLCYCTVAKYPPPPPPPSPPPLNVFGGWVAGGGGESCTAACENKGYKCYDEEQAAHLSEHDSLEAVSKLLGRLNFPESGQPTKCAVANDWQGPQTPLYENPAWTNGKGAFCSFSAVDRAVDSYACGYAVSSVSHRLCYCSIPPPSPPPPPPPPPPLMHCATIGDPHVTSFSGLKCDLMGVGVFPLVELNDPCATKAVHVQSFHCPMIWATPESGQQSVNAGVAIKAGNASVSIIKSVVTVNGAIVPVDSYEEKTVTPLTNPPVTVALSRNVNDSILVTVGDVTVWSSSLANDRARSNYEQSLVVSMPEQTGGNSAFGSSICAIETENTAIPVYHGAANSKIIFSQPELDSLQAACGKPAANVTQGTCTTRKSPESMCSEAKISLETVESKCKEGCPCHTPITLSDCAYDFCAGAKEGSGDVTAITTCAERVPCA